MECAESLEWNCIEWITPDQVKRFKVLNPTTDQCPVNAGERLAIFDDGIEYTGRLLASNKTHSIFDLFTSVMSYNDVKMFLKSNHVCDVTYCGPGLALRAYMLLVDLHAKNNMAIRSTDNFAIKEEATDDYETVEIINAEPSNDSSDESSVQFSPIVPSKKTPPRRKRRLRSNVKPPRKTQRTLALQLPSPSPPQTAITAAAEKNQHAVVPYSDGLHSYMTPTLTKVTSEQTQNSQGYYSVLFHFTIDDIVYGGRKEALYKGKNKHTIMYLRCVNHNPNTTDCKWKCRLRLKCPLAAVGSDEYCDVSNYETITNTKTCAHSTKCKNLSRMRMEHDLAPEFHVSELKRFKQHRTILSLEQKMDIIRHRNSHGATLSQLASYFTDLFDKKINRQLIATVLKNEERYNNEWMSNAGLLALE